MMPERTFSHVVAYPLAGDVIEVREHAESDGEPFVAENMLRVISVAEGCVWFKQYGSGRKNIYTFAEWRARLEKAVSGEVIRGADHDAPF